MRSAIVWVGLPLWLVATAAAAAVPLDWLQGTWCARQGPDQYEERWSAGPGDLWLGLSRGSRGEATRSFEFLRIERRGETWVYLAQPQGRKATAFAQTEVRSDAIDFANAEHDFPQRIRYWREGAQLLAEIAGPGPDGERSWRLQFEAGACRPDAPVPLEAQTGAVAEPTPARTMGDILAAAPDAHWRDLDPARSLALDLDSGRVLIELAPEFAPAHVANVLTLAGEGYFDGLAIVRVQDNFVVQWADPESENDELKRPLGSAQARLAAEFSRPIGVGDVDFLVLPDADGYAPEVGFSVGMHAARDRAADRTWLAHCYGTVGVGRDNEPDSGGGSELYVVIGHAPRQLDQNITVIGRVVQGMELLSSLPRGSGPLGFYQDPQQRVPLRRLRLVSALPEDERPQLQLLRTDSSSFSELIEARRNRRDAWYHRPAGYIDLCSVPLPVRSPP